MKYYNMGIHNNPDAKAWAEFFMHTLKENNWSIEDIDESLMIGWFANAMMAMFDHLNNTVIIEQTEKIAELQDADESLTIAYMQGFEDAKKKFKGSDL